MNDLAPFESPKLTIDSAKECLLDFEAACQRFIDDCTYDVIRHCDFNTGEQVIKCRLHHKIPGKLRILAYRIIADLRNALDQAMCDAALGTGRTNVKNIHFPFGRMIGDLENQIKSFCRGVHPDLLAFVWTLKPHYGGDDLLYAFSVLAGPNKHQRILSISTGSVGGLIDTTKSLLLVGPFTIFPRQWNMQRNEIEIARIGRGGYFEANLTPTFQIVVGTGEPPLSGNAPSVFRDLTRKIECIILGLEAETARIQAAN